LGDTEEIWAAEQLAERWGLDAAKLGPAEAGTGMAAHDALNVRLPDKGILLDYVRRCFALADQAVDAVDDRHFPAPLSSHYSTEPTTIGETILANLQHERYHLGQLRYLKKMMRRAALPPRSPTGTIRAVIFDIGGVLVRTDDVTAQRRWEARLGLPEGRLGEIVYRNPVSQRATVGDATTEEVWAEVGRQLGLSPAELEALQEDFWAGSAWDAELLAFIRSLRPRFKTGTISDAWLDARETIVEYVNSDLFDVSVFSAEEGLRKPDPEIYRRALSRLGVAPQEAIYVDDRPPNVEGASRIGMQAIQFTDSRAVRQEIQRLIRAQACSG
jgi:epoxide hydrolase-like predicted phosphatase